MNCVLWSILFLLFSCSGEPEKLDRTTIATPQSTPATVVWGPSEGPVKSPVTTEQLVSVFPRLSDLPPMASQQIVAAFNLVASPCSECQGLSIAGCSIKPSVGTKGCPVLLRLFDRVYRYNENSPRSTSDIIEVVTHTDVWSAIPIQKENFVAVEVWFAPDSKALKKTLQLVFEIDNAFVRFRPTLNDSEGVGRRFSDLGWVQFNDQVGHKMSEIVIQNPIKWDTLFQELSNLSTKESAIWLNDKALRVIQQNGRLTSKLGVRSTPTWFIDGFRLRGLQSIDQIQRVIDLCNMDKGE